MKNSNYIEFYFDCSSPWTYLAFTEILELSQRLNFEIIWKPILVGGVFNNVNKDVSICGELGGDPMASMLLLGLGKLTDLSMELHSIPKVKKIIRLIRLEEARQMADHVLGLSTVEEISRFIATEMRTRFPDDFDRDLSFQEKLKPA